MLTLKLTDELLAKIGVTTEKEALALLESSKPNADKLASKDKDITELRADLSKAVERLSVVEGRKVELSAADKSALATEMKGSPEILAAVKAAAQTETTAILAKFGGKPVGQGDKPADVTDPEKGKVIAPDDFKAQWDADENLRSEFFDNFKVYEAYAKANANGQIRTNVKK